MKVVDAIAMILLIIGGLNWGLIGFFDFNLVAAIFGENTALTNIIYILVGISALWALFFWNGFHARLAPADRRPVTARKQQPVG